jgi:hypothetical protein
VFCFCVPSIGFLDVQMILAEDDVELLNNLLDVGAVVPINLFVRHLFGTELADLTSLDVADLDDQLAGCLVAGVWGVGVAMYEFTLACLVNQGSFAGFRAVLVVVISCVGVFGRFCWIHLSQQTSGVQSELVVLQPFQEPELS